MIAKTDTVEAIREGVMHFNEEQVREFGNWCLDRAEQMKKQRQETVRLEVQADLEAAMERNRQRCEAAGIEFKPDLSKKAKAKKSKPTGLPVFKAHHRYEDPEDATKFWNGVGPKPQWVRDRLAAGKTPIDRGPMKETKAA